MYLSIQGFAKIEIRELNRDFAKICSFRAMTAELGLDAARQLLGKAKKGDKLGEGRLDGDPDRPYWYVLHDLVVRNILERNNGTARVLPATVRTTLRDTVTRNSPRCAFTMTNAREITIALAGSSVPGTYALTIPLNTAGDWSFTPLLPAMPPLFRGPATIATTMTTVPDGNCTTPGGTVSRTTNYVHQELNDITFGTHQLQPVCGAGHQIPVAFTKVPNLGTPNAADITAGCSVRSAQARFSFQRRF